MSTHAPSFNVSIGQVSVLGGVGVGGVTTGGVGVGGVTTGGGGHGDGGVTTGGGV